jgi:hypothetical protein
MANHHYVPADVASNDSVYGTTHYIHHNYMDAHGYVHADVF